MEDKGFALKPWTNVRFENAGLILEKSRAFCMGNYFFTDTKGNEIKENPYLNTLLNRSVTVSSVIISILTEYLYLCKVLG